MVDVELLAAAMLAGAAAFAAKLTKPAKPARGKYQTIDWTARGAPRNPGGFSPEGLTLHYAAGVKGGDPADVLYQTSQLGYSYSYLIDRDGTRYQLVEDDEGAVHTDNVRNASSYGFAFMNIGPAQSSRPGWPYAPIPGVYPAWPGAYWEPYTSDQIRSSAELARRLLPRGGYLIGHQDVNADKSDPGPAFPWAEFERQSGLTRG